MLPVGSMDSQTAMWRQGLPMGGLGRTLGEGTGDQTVLKSPRLPPLTQRLPGARPAPPQRERPLRPVGKAPGARTGRARPRPEESHQGSLQTRPTAIPENCLWQHAEGLVLHAAASAELSPAPATSTQSEPGPKLLCAKVTLSRPCNAASSLSKSSLQVAQAPFFPALPEETLEG